MKYYKMIFPFPDDMENIALIKANEEGMEMIDNHLTKGQIRLFKGTWYFHDAQEISEEEYKVAVIKMMMES